LKDLKLESIRFLVEEPPDETENENVLDVMQLFNVFPSSLKIIIFMGLQNVTTNPVEITGFGGTNPKILTHLHLESCTGIVTDNTMQIICKSLTNLVYLCVSETDNSLTDYGITGRELDHDVPEFALWNLRGKKKIFIYAICTCKLYFSPFNVHRLAIALFEQLRWNN